MPGCGRGAPPAGLGRNWAQTEAQGGWWGPGSAAGGGAAASPRLLFKPHNIKGERASTGFAGLIEPVYRGVAIGWVRGTTARVLVRVAKPAAKRCRSGTGLRNGRIVRDPALHKGEGLGKYGSTYVPMHHIHPHCLNRTVPHLMPPCDLQMSGTGRQICGR